MPLSTPATFKAATDYLGVAYTSIQSTLDSQNSNSSLSGVKSFRLAVRAAAVTADTDDNDTLADVARAVELGLPITVGDVLNDSAAGLEAYCQSQFSASMRSHFKSTITNWTDGFRALWRHARAEELIVRVGTLNRGMAIWTYTPDHVIGLDTAMEIRAVLVNVNVDIVVNLTMTTESGTNYLATARVPAGTAPGTTFNLVGGPAKYTGVASITMSGGDNTDSLEVWLV